MLLRTSSQDFFCQLIAKELVNFQCVRARLETNPIHLLVSILGVGFFEGEKNKICSDKVQ